MSQIKYDIAVPPVVTSISTNRIKVDYVYVFPDCVNITREMGKIKRQRRMGWTKYDSDSVVYYGTLTHLWFYTVYYKRIKPVKRFKLEE